MVVVVSPSTSSVPVVSLSQVAAAAAVVALTSVIVSTVRSLRRQLRAAKLLAVPGPKGHVLFGLVPELIKNAHRVWDFQSELVIKYGGRARIPGPIFGNDVLYLGDPKDVEHVLSKNVDNWIKSDRFIASVGEVFEKSLLGINHAHTADGGALFRLQRKVVTRVFTTTNFKALTEGIFHKYTTHLADRIMAEDGKCDMHKISSQFTMQTTFDIVCGVPLETIDKDLGLQFIESMDFVFSSISWRGLTKPYFTFLWWCMPDEYRLKREIKVVNNLVDPILKQRLEESEEEIAKRYDMLSLFIKKARELEGEEGTVVLNITTLRSIIASLIFAGRDTASSSIVYAFYALAQYPEEQDKILEELKTIDTTTMNVDDVKKLKYLDAFVWETMRLYPTVPANLKQAAEDDVLPDGTFIPAGTEIMYSPYYMGRNNAKLWGEDQLVFRPERWLSMPRRPTAYEFPVFQGGPRICPGMNMALLETKIFVAILLQKFHVKIQDGEQVKDRPYVLGPTMMMKDGLPLQLTPRQASAQ